MSKDGRERWHASLCAIVAMIAKTSSRLVGACQHQEQTQIHSSWFAGVARDAAAATLFKEL